MTTKEPAAIPTDDGNPTSWRTADISWACAHLTENTAFNGVAILREWDAMKAIALAAEIKQPVPGPILSDERIAELMMLIQFGTTAAYFKFARAIESEVAALAAVPGQSEPVYQIRSNIRETTVWQDSSKADFDRSIAPKRTLYATHPSPVSSAPVDEIYAKAGYWLRCLTDCAKLLELPDDTPIPSGVVEAVRALSAVPVAVDRNAVLEEASLCVMAMHSRIGDIFEERADAAHNVLDNVAKELRALKSAAPLQQSAAQPAPVSGATCVTISGRKSPA